MAGNEVLTQELSVGYLSPFWEVLPVLTTGWVVMALSTQWRKTQNVRTVERSGQPVASPCGCKHRGCPLTATMPVPTLGLGSVCFRSWPQSGLEGTVDSGAKEL